MPAIIMIDGKMFLLLFKASFLFAKKTSLHLRLVFACAPGIDVLSQALHSVRSVEPITGDAVAKF